MALSTSYASQQEIKTALGESASGVIALCLSTKINKFAGRKPFRSNATSYTYSELTNALKAANFGLSLAGYSSAASALNLAAGGTELWQYLRPQNTSSSPCRQGDFRGYNHAAPVPYSAYVGVTDITQGSSNGAFELEITQASGAEVTVSQMGSFSGGKWVCLWRPTGGSTSVEQGANITTSNNPVTITVEGLGTAGTYECCAAILVNGQYYPVPNTYKTFTLSVLPIPLEVAWLVCEWNAAFTEVSFEIGIKNNRSYAQTVGALTITLRETSGFDPSGGVQPSGSSPASFSSTSTSVPANSTSTVKTGKFTGITYDQSKNYFVCVMSSSGSQIPFQYNAIEEPEPQEI